MKLHSAKGEILITTVLFFIAVCLYYVVAAWGVAEHLEQGAFKSYVTGAGAIWEAMVVGLVFGLLLSVVNIYSDVPRLRSLPFGQMILIKSLLYIVGLVITAACVQLIFRLFLFSPQEMEAIVGTVTPRWLLSAAAWFVSSILGINFIMEVRRKVGPGNLTALFTGRYRRPKLEHKVFLFLDLKSSTAIAERLGPETYSRFLRRCFHDLDEILLSSGAQIYQYAGDEVILIWPIRPGSEATYSAMQAFFIFQEKLSGKRQWYEKQFGFAPVFRGGMDFGEVTATEVGGIKREIAYHGDALNTAARLLELSKKFADRLVISGMVKDTLVDPSGFFFEHCGEVTLRGKTEKISIYSADIRTA